MTNLAKTCRFEAKLPLGKSLDMCEFDKMTSINVAQIMLFAETIQLVEQAHNLITNTAGPRNKTFQKAIRINTSKYLAKSIMRRSTIWEFYESS